MDENDDPKVIKFKPRVAPVSEEETVLMCPECECTFWIIYEDLETKCAWCSWVMEREDE